ncbi:MULTISPECIES: CBS domain-containing protein [Hoeflea]|uniref:CBS domain-containing protein n=1 Tax=Hoeflea algicola TaxID=2983763 RepID=A0ABT3ZG54_9HYPH|nr:CBS domain-containing protein [Hoeflea algicola]MCY0150792.1 CBS domain-containing protein [Hoeflea algicola]
MQAHDIMTNKVITAERDTSVEQIAALMMKHHISAVPIVEKGRVVGLVSEGDLMLKVEGAVEKHRSWWLSVFANPDLEASEYVALHGRRAKDIMTTNVVTIPSDMPVGEIARLLEKKHFKRVPVLDDGELVGIVSRANLLHAMAAVPVIRFESSSDDQEKRDIILGALAEAPRLSIAQLNVVVEGGRVDVWGIAASDAEEAAVRVALANIEGLGEVSVNIGRLPNYAWGI